MVATAQAMGGLLSVMADMAGLLLVLQAMEPGMGGHMVGLSDTAQDTVGLSTGTAAMVQEPDTVEALEVTAVDIPS